MNHVVDSPISQLDPGPRRSFFVRLAATVIGGIVALFPFAAGLGVLSDPLFRRRIGVPNGEADNVFVRIGPLDMLPADGVPRQFAVFADVVDAWTRVPAQRIGTVFLSYKSAADGPQVVALSSICPHLGCAVDYKAADGRFECPCHASAFAPSGEKLFGPSLRGLDPLEVKLVESGDRTDIWIAPQRFHSGVAERVPIG